MDIFWNSTVLFSAAAAAAAAGNSCGKVELNPLTPIYSCLVSVDATKL